MPLRRLPVPDTRTFNLLVPLLFLFNMSIAAAAPVARLEVDATDASNHVIHIKQWVPLQPGSAALVLPKWLPGEHAPTGPINDVINLHIQVRGQPVRWTRDPLDPYTFKLDLPPGTTAVEATFDAVTGVGGRGAPSPAAASAQLLVLKWNTMLLYPQGAAPGTYAIAASVRLPSGWKWGSALRPQGGGSNSPRFAPTALETLVDSPLLAGAYTRRFDLTPPGGPPHALFAAADSQRALEVEPQTIAGYRNLVREAGALFGARPFSQYVFLLALSNHIPHGGLEHHESSDNRVAEETWIDESKALYRAGLLPHEYVHAWNGKHRRPRGLVVSDYQQPYDTSLLWVYEGLTSYLGEVLTARSGLRSLQSERDVVAMTAAGMDLQAGRLWRPLADTATSAAVLNFAVKHWRSSRRGLDYYPEMVLIWLEADATIRRISGGTRSLDDFCKVFFGSADGKPSVLPYDRAQLVGALKQVAEHDWDAFFNTRIDQINKQASASALAAAGWKLTFEAKPTVVFRAVESSIKEINLAASLGLVATDEGAIVDVIAHSPAAQAKLAPAMQIIAVNGRRYAPDRLRAAVAETPQRGWVELLVENSEFFATRKVFWRKGQRHPKLDPTGEKDWLTPILSPRRDDAL